VITSISKTIILLTILIFFSKSILAEDISLQAGFETNYYSWSGNKGTKGYQVVTPLHFSIHQEKDFGSLDAAVRVAHIESENTSSNISMNLESEVRNIISSEKGGGATYLGYICYSTIHSYVCII
jgi:hypothetical protein